VNTSRLFGQKLITTSDDASIKVVREEERKRGKREKKSAIGGRSARGRRKGLLFLFQSISSPLFSLSPSLSLSLSLSHPFLSLALAA
jgi:hypothetical protein